MEFDLALDGLDGVLPWLRNTATGLVQPWRLYQLGFLVAYLL